MLKKLNGCKNGNPTLRINPDPLLSKAAWCRHFIYLKSLKFSHFKMVEAMGLKINISESSLIS
jgi:hypothetical protein